MLKLHLTAEVIKTFDEFTQPGTTLHFVYVLFMYLILVWFLSTKEVPQFNPIEAFKKGDELIY